MDKRTKPLLSIVRCTEYFIVLLLHAMGGRSGCQVYFSRMWFRVATATAGPWVSLRQISFVATARFLDDDGVRQVVHSI